MKKLLLIACLLTLIGIGLVAALPASAGDVTESCTDVTLDVEEFVVWLSVHVHVEVDNIQVIVWNVVISDTSWIDVEGSYVDVDGGIIHFKYTIPLKDDCTPDWSKAHEGWNCDTTVDVERGGFWFGGIFYHATSEVTFEQWLGITFRGRFTGIHFTETEYDFYFNMYLGWVRTTLTTSTTSCSTYIGPHPQEMLLFTFNGGNVSEFAGAPVSYYMVDSFGTEHFINSGVVGEYGDISIIVPPGSYPSDPAYGEYNVIDGFGNQSVITPSRMFVARVNGMIVETVIQGPSNGDQDPVGYVVLANTDTVNMVLRTSTPNRIAWK